jgi:hypothetical protein
VTEQRLSLRRRARRLARGSQRWWHPRRLNNPSSMTAVSGRAAGVGAPVIGEAAPRLAWRAQALQLLSALLTTDGNGEGEPGGGKAESASSGGLSPGPGAEAAASGGVILMRP